MNNDQLINLKLLKISNLIASKNLIIANANREANLDGWLSDWNKGCDEIDKEIEFEIGEVYKI